MSRNIFEVKNLTYSYLDGINALVDVSLKIDAGEKVAILGANGSGKSTLLRILDGLIFPQEGSISAFSTPLTETGLDKGDFAQSFRKKVGLVFQNPDVQLFSSTVYDEVAFGPIQMDMSEDQVAKCANRVLEMLDLKRIEDRHPYDLSEGEKKKVAIASVLSYDPEVLLLDEPTAGLDPKTQAWIVDCIVELNSQGKTVVTSTHDLAIVPETADRVYILSEDHKLIAQGEPDELLRNEELLVQANLAHYHVHRHGKVTHKHGHLHIGEGHEHKHPDK